jgi:hypothetical protein
MEETDFTTPHYGIVPPTGLYGEDWPSGTTPTFPQGIHGEISKGGWSKGNEGFAQQTFLGASISTFNIKAGFGQSSTTLNATLVVDEFNKSDGTLLGSGDDVYHNGKNDFFRPPTVGSPVFFKFGKNHANIDEAYRKTYYEIYEKPIPKIKEPTEKFTEGPINNIPKNYFLDEERPLSQEPDEIVKWEDQTVIKDPEYEYRGWNHFVFGGILSQYKKDEGAARTLNVVVSDPREILSNVQLILNDYKGGVGNNKNIINIYGFLEYERSLVLYEQMENRKSDKNLIFRNFNGDFIGSLPDPITGEPTADSYMFDRKQYPYWTAPKFHKEPIKNPCFTSDDFKEIHRYFPVTGAGMARRNKQGIPWYRVYQALKATTTWCGWDFGFAPCEYLLAGFGGIIDFRGRNFVVDLTGLPLKKIPQLYQIDSDQIDLLSLIQEVCDAISHDYVVSLLPVLNSPRTGRLYEYNRTCMIDERFGDIITGIIRIDTIDKTVQPKYGTVVEYIENLEKNGVQVENKNLGFETSNVVTDRIVNGHQEVGMYEFSNVKNDLTELETYDIAAIANTQQILPFFGYMDEEKRVAVIPKGGQICLNAANIAAVGVGEYYITTVSELLAAQAGYENWAAFLSYYNYRYVRSVGFRERNGEYTKIAKSLRELTGASDKLLETIQRLQQDVNEESYFDDLRQHENIECYVPRCVWPSESPYTIDYNTPANPCSPPYGYPLYFGRATAVGIDIGRYQGILDYLTVAPKFVQKKMQNALNGVLTLGSANDLWKYDTADFYQLLEGNLTNGEVYSEIERRFEFVYRLNMTDTLNNLTTLGEEKFKKDLIESGLTEDSVKKITDAANGIQKWLDKINNQKDATRILNPDVRNDRFLDEDVQTDLAETGKTVFKNYRSNFAASRRISQAVDSDYKRATEIHSWLKGIADEYLGKKYLVKLPQATNLNYRFFQKTQTLRVNSVAITSDVFAGPYGFPPIPIAGRSYPSPPPLLTNRNYEFLSANYANSAAAWTHGALRVNWNEVSLDWEFNYKPEPAGGFGIIFDGDVMVQTSKFLEEGRELSYFSFSSKMVRGSDGFFVESSLNLEDIPKEDVYTDTDLITSENYTDTIKTIYVRCNVEEKFVMLPRIVQREVKVFGDGLTPLADDSALINALAFRPINDFFSLEYCPGDNTLRSRLAYANRWGNRPRKDAYAGYMGKKVVINDFLRTIDGSSALVQNLPDPPGYINEEKSWSKTTVTSQGVPEKFLVDKRFINPDHVYAVVSLPGVIKAAKQEDAKSTFQSKSRLAAVPQFVPGMDRITARGSVNIDDVIDGSFGDGAELTIQDAADLSNPENKLYFQAEEPIPPDYVTLALMSMDRCYGPWMSASILDSGNPQVRYADIGGKVEYIKDENLAPWNFGSYIELNVAGSFKAQFSNSLLLFSENGSFTFPDAPAGLTIAKPLHHPQGPLVTSVDVSIGDSVKTTVTMDSFSANFGQLKKQTEEFISVMGKERRKILDERNRRLRDPIKKGLQRVPTSTFTGSDFARYNQLFGHSTAQTELSCSSIRTSGQSLSEGEDFIRSKTQDVRTSQTTTYYNSASISDNNDFLSQTAGVNEDQNQYSKKLKATGRENLNNFFIPFDHQPDNPNMPNYDFISKYSIDRRTS